ncbi:MAG TPA: tetratricopeptide repeat protein [Vicinamibacterales bacterium]|nr:tetratricopeptide repeat protein [Vicinamibacterales bacterium]
MPARVRAALLAALVVPTIAYSQPPTIQRGEDFPLEDYSVWLFVDRGLKSQAADVQLAKDPESPEAIPLLLDVDRTGDALTVLRRIVDRRPERMGAAFKAASTNWHRLVDEGRGYPAVLREIAAKARQRLRELPREQAAEATWYLFLLPIRVPGETPAPWRDQLPAFISEYAGTEASLLAELTILDDGGDIHARIVALEAFARRHPGTIIGAQALWTAGMHLGFNAREPSSADPTDRLLRIAALTRELQSGAYPDCEWVRRAPQNVFGFFTSEPQYAKENLPRVVAVLREFLLKNFEVAPVNPLASGAGLVIATKLPPIFAAGGGDAVTETDRFLLDLEKAVDQPAAVRYVRGMWYRQLANGAKDVEKQNEWRLKSDATLLDLARTGTGLNNRKALASLASISFKERNCDVAVERYQEYVSRFPESEWAWVAGLRAGQCEQFLGNWAKARQAYESVTAARRAPPPALVLGHTFAGRASEALNDFERARTAYTRAERAWEQRFADPYFGTYQFHTRLDEEPCNGCDPRSKADVSREWLHRRTTQLRRSRAVPAGTLLERGRFMVTEGIWRSAIAPLTDFIRLHPDSPSALEAHELLTRAKLEMVLLRAGPEASEDEKRAALTALESLAAEPYGFSVFAAQIARATLQSIVGSPDRASELMSEALVQWHQHGVDLFAKRSATALQQDIMDIRDVVFNPNVNWPSDEFSRFRSRDSPPKFFIVTPEVRVKLHDDSVVHVEAASRLSAKPGAVLLDEEQIAVLERILMSLGGTKQRVHVEHIEKFWNRFFTMGPGHWGGWILQTFPMVTEVTFIDAPRTRGAARIRNGYQGSTQLLTKADGTWKVTGSSGHWIE